MVCTPDGSMVQPPQHTEEGGSPGIICGFVSLPRGEEAPLKGLLPHMVPPAADFKALQDPLGGSTHEDLEEEVAVVVADQVGEGR